MYTRFLNGFKGLNWSSTSYIHGESLLCGKHPSDKSWNSKIREYVSSWKQKYITGKPRYFQKYLLSEFLFSTKMNVLSSIYNYVSSDLEMATCARRGMLDVCWVPCYDMIAARSVILAWYYSMFYTMKYYSNKS